jgi:hypothetical protein
MIVEVSVVPGRAKAAMVAVEYDEFGAARAEHIRARLFADLMTDLGLDTNWRGGSPVSGSEQPQCRMLTARAITRSDVTRAATLSTLIRNLAREESGMVSVGLKAVELVTDT